MANGYYEDGTASVAGAVVTGIGTAFLSRVRVGDKFTRNGYSMPIEQVNSNTSLTLESAWPGAGAAASYKVELLPDLTRNLEALEAYLQLAGMDNIEALAGLDGTGGDKVPYFTGAGVMATIDRADLVRLWPQGRLTLVSNVPAPETDVAAATVIYYTSARGGDLVPVYNGADMVGKSFGDQVSLPLDANTGHTLYQNGGGIFDLYAISVGGALRLASAAAWTTATARQAGIALERFDGLVVNANSMQMRYGTAAGDVATVAARQGTYLGTFNATANGQATDTARLRLLYNAYNQTERRLYAGEAAASWTYSTNSWRAANANNANMVNVLLGLTGTLVTAEVIVYNQGDASASYSNTAIGLGVGSATEPSVDCIPFSGFFAAAGKTQITRTTYNGYPGLGYRSLVWLERGPGAGTVTWYAGGFKSALQGRFLG